MSNRRPGSWVWVLGIFVHFEPLDFFVFPAERSRVLIVRFRAYLGESKNAAVSFHELECVAGSLVPLGATKT